MNIRLLIKKMTLARNEIERKVIQNEIENTFSSLTDDEKKVVRKDFLVDLYEVVGEGKKLLNRIDMCVNNLTLEPA